MNREYEKSSKAVDDVDNSVVLTSQSVFLLHVKS